MGVACVNATWLPAGTTAFARPFTTLLLLTPVPVPLIAWKPIWVAYADARSDRTTRSNGTADWSMICCDTVCVPPRVVNPVETNDDVMSVEDRAEFCVDCTATDVPVTSFGMLILDTPDGTSPLLNKSAVTLPGRAMLMYSSINHCGGANSPPEPPVAFVLPSARCSASTILLLRSSRSTAERASCPEPRAR